MLEGKNYNLSHVWKSYGISGSPDGFLTVGNLRDAVACFPDDAQVIFGPCEHGQPLQFMRFKQRGENLLAIEFG